MTIEPVQAACWHEASHCISFLLAGARIRSVEIAQDGSGLTRVLTLRRAPLAPFVNSLCILAGPFGEAYFAGHLDRAHCRSDRDEALALIGDHEIDRAVDAVTVLVDRHRRAIGQLADILSRRRYLDEDQLMRLIGR